MNTLTNGLLKRALSILLVTIMVFSLGIVGITSTSAAETELAETGASTVCLSGSFNEWAMSDSDYQFTSTGDNTYTLTKEFEAETYYFRIVVNGSDIFASGGTINDSNSSWNLYSTTSDTVCFVATGGTYTFNFTHNGGSSNPFSITKDSSSGGNTGDDSGETTGTVPETIYLNTAFWDDTSHIEKYTAVFNDGSSNTTVEMTYVGANLYSFAVPENATKVTFYRLDGSGGDTDGTQWNYSAEMTIPTNGNNLFTVADSWNDYGSETIGWSVYSISDVLGEFWVDTNANIEYSETAIDILKPYENGDTYYLYLPSGVDTTKLKFYAAEEGISVNGTAISTTGTEISVTADGSTEHTLTGADVSKLVVFQSTASALYTKTDEAMPVEPGYNTSKADGIHKDDYETENVKTENADGTVTNSQFYAMADSEGSLIAGEAVLKKVKGRGNSSWKASVELFGKYAFNITLDKKADLVGDDGTKSKKYCLISYNADEARMRNMLVYGLSQEIGIEFVADYTPVDLYNNNRYIGSYLLTDKVEIGDPLVNLTDANGDEVNLDDVNAAVEGNEAICDSPDGYREAGYIVSGTYNTYNNSVTTDLNVTSSSKTGYFKYVDMTEPDASIYQDSGFLLEFEINDRFADEISGFISNKGQQIVCKYPELATKEEMLFIMGKWNKAEEKMYDSTAEYEDLDKLIDVESFARMYLIQELTKNVDAGATSYYVYYNDGKLHAGCSWDFDWALGQYAKTRTLVSGNSKFSATNSTALSNPEGWWASIKQIYADTNATTGVYNAQAALCQNDAFWEVVQAEWNECFYNAAMKYVVDSASTTSVSNLTSADIYSLYTAVHASTEMDESRWGFIEADKMGTSGESNSWGSKDTGDTHDAAVVWLNDFIYDRMTWLNANGLMSDDYTIQPPVLSIATAVPEGGFTVGDEVTINIENKTGGSYNYKIYKNDELIKTVTTDSFTVTAENGDVEYKVIALSKNSGLESDKSTAVTVTGSGYCITPSLAVSSSAVLTGDTVTLTPSIAEEYTDVTYEIYHLVDGGEAKLLDGTTYTQNTAGQVQFYVVATATVEGETVFASTEANPVTVTFSEFTVSVKATSNGNVMQSQDVTITATPSVEGDVTYTFYKDGEVITDYENVKTNTYTEKMEDAGTFEYKVVASYAGKTADATVTVNVQAYDGTFNVKILFKSSTVGAYRPTMKINGTAVDVTEDTAIEVNKVGNGISTYSWFSYTLPDEQTYGTSITVEVEGQRDYFYKASYTFQVGHTDYASETIDGITSYYLALDNLNNRSVSTLSNISASDAYIRNWTQSATHMIYNKTYDGVLSAPVGFSFRFADYGDANCDGKINIKDATYVQKSLANFVEADSLSTTVSDYNRDGRVTIKDATAIQKAVAGL